MGTVQSKVQRQNWQSPPDESRREVIASANGASEMSIDPSVKGTSVPVEDLYPIEKEEGVEPRGIPAHIFWKMYKTRGHGVVEKNCILRDNDEAFTNKDSQVMVSLTELTTTGVPMLAPASMEVWNVTPRTVNPPDRGSVLLRLNIQWHEDIPFRINMIIVN
jgi:hypothetical protein